MAFMRLTRPSDSSDLSLNKLDPKDSVSWNRYYGTEVPPGTCFYPVYCLYMCVCSPVTKKELHTTVLQNGCSGFRNNRVKTDWSASHTFLMLLSPRLHWANIHCSRCQQEMQYHLPKNKQTKDCFKILAFHNFSTLYFQIRRERCVSRKARWDLHLLSSPVQLNDHNIQAENSPMVPTLQWVGDRSLFVSNWSREAISNVTAGHGHHHTSGTWGQKNRGEAVLNMVTEES